MSATAAAASPSSRPQCQVILTLAHLLRQRSHTYDVEKDALLDASVKKCVTTKIQMANQHHHNQHQDQEEEEGEVHMVLTGSPRPTFAETNAWLLEATGAVENKLVTPRKKSKDDNAPRGSYSILDNNITPMPRAAADDDVSMDSASKNNNDEDDDESMGQDDGATGAQLLQEYIAECTHNSSTPNANMDDLGGSPTRVGGSVLEHYRERKYSHGDMSAGGVTKGSVTNNKNNSTIGDNNEKENNGSGNSSNETSDETSAKGPMVGHAVVNAISQTRGVGLYSSRAQLLQGTIDRPLWDQRRWTDGECLFSDLVARCGLESFENVGAAGSSSKVDDGVAAGGADAAAGAGVLLPNNPPPPTSGTGRLRKTTKLSAHLITVPAPNPSNRSSNLAASLGDEVPGLEEDTMEEIARGILRVLKRKKSPPASVVYLVLPCENSNSGGMEEERKEVVVARLSAAWQKLEQYNEMIGAPRLMADATLEFVDVSI